MVGREVVRPARRTSETPTSSGSRIRAAGGKGKEFRSSLTAGAKRMYKLSSPHSDLNKKQNLTRNPRLCYANDRNQRSHLLPSTSASQTFLHRGTDQNSKTGLADVVAPNAHRGTEVRVLSPLPKTSHRSGTVDRVQER